MNLFELAHHPKMNFKSHLDLHDKLCWSLVSTNEQMNMLDPSYNDSDEADSAANHTDENEFRMHLLFVHWATLED